MISKRLALGAAALTLATIASPAAAGDARPEFLPPTPQPVVIWHCGPDVTSGRAVLVKHGRTYNVVAKGAQVTGGRVVARCAPTPAPVRVVN